MEEQGYHDRRDEHLAMRRHHREGKAHGDHKGYSMKGAHDYDRSMKHRERESAGMKKYEKKYGR